MIPVRSLGELIDRVTPEEPDAMTGRLRDYGVYRGGSNADAYPAKLHSPLAGSPSTKLAFLIDLDRIFGEDGNFTPWKLFAEESRDFDRRECSRASAFSPSKG